MRYGIKKSKAQSLIEYALILALVTVVAIVALQLLGKKVNTAVETAGNSLNDSTSGAQAAYCQSIGGTMTNGVCQAGNSGSGS